MNSQEGRKKHATPPTTDTKTNIESILDLDIYSILLQLFTYLSSLLQYLLQFIPLDKFKQFFHSNSNNSNSTKNSNGDSIYNDKANLNERLKASYEFMEITFPVEKDELNKKYKKMSLLYHPDRCNGSDESKENFQKLGACYKLLKDNLHLDPNATIHTSTSTSNNNSNNSDNETESDDDDYFYTKEEYEEMKQKYYEAQEQYEKEMKRQFYKAKEQQRMERAAFNKKKKKAKKKMRKYNRVNRLTTEEGRDAHHDAFCRQAQAFDGSRCEGSTGSGGEKEEEEECDKNNKRRDTQERKDSPQSNMNDIDTDDDDDDNDQHQPKETTTNSDKKHHDAAKPRNFVMENNVDEDIVIALKMGYYKHSMELFVDMYLSKGCALTWPLDTEGNTIAHYAVYYEAEEFLSFYCDYLFSKQMKELKNIFHHENRRGHSSLYYAKIAKDESIKTMLEDYITRAQDLIDETTSWSAMMKKMTAILYPAWRVLLFVLGSGLACIQLLDIALAYGFRWYFSTSMLYAIGCIQVMKFNGLVETGIIWAIGHYTFGLGFYYSIVIFFVTKHSCTYCCSLDLPPE